MHKAKSLLYHPYFILAVIVLIAFWPLTFQQYVIPHDMVNCWIPWRHFISDCIQNGEFPWWNPYQQMGYPIHADLQGPTWHLESILASMVGRQGPVYIQYAYLVYLWIGAIGFHKLAHLFTKVKWIHFVAGIAYITSGFFISHSMHFFAIISAAFVPHILYHVIKMMDENSKVHALIASVFIFFNLTGGYHTFTILLIYLLAPIAIYYGIKHYKKSRKSFKEFILSGLLFTASSTILASVIIVVYAQLKPFLQRLSHLPFDEASQFPFSPNSTMSFLNPMAPINEAEWIGTNPTMSNGYFGLAFLLLLLLSVMRKLSSIEKIIAAFGFFCLLCSFGTYTPVYEIVHDYFPLLGKFRFPAYFSFFFVLSALILGLKTLELIFIEKEIEKSQIWYVSSFLGLILISTIVYGITQLDGSNFWLFNSIKETNLGQNLTYYGILQLIMLGLITFSLLKRKKVLLIALICVDGFISLQPQFLAQEVGTSKPHEIENTLSEFNSNDLPLRNPVADNQYYHHYMPHLWQNVNHLDKRIGYDGFNSNYFTDLWNLTTIYKHQSDSLFQNGFAYISDEIVPYSQFLADTSVAYSKSTVFVADEDFSNFSSIHPTEDTLSYVINTQFEIADIRFMSKTKEAYSLNLLQSYYPGWIAYVDGVDTKINKTNSMFMSIPITEGTHDIVFLYENKLMKTAAIISYSTLGCILLILSFIFIKRRKSNAIAIGIAWIGVGSICLYYFYLL